MTNPNQNTSEDTLWRFQEASYERMRVELKCSVELKLKEFGLTWDDLAKLLKSNYTGISLKKYVGTAPLPLEELNLLAHIFSCEPYIIFRPRKPWTKT